MILTLSSSLDDLDVRGSGAAHAFFGNNLVGHFGLPGTFDDADELGDVGGRYKDVADATVCQFVGQLDQTHLNFEPVLDLRQIG